MPLNQNQLKKMLVIEAIGEKLYRALASKTKDQNSKSLYIQLAIAESQTAEIIEKEISRTKFGVRTQ